MQRKRKTKSRNAEGIDRLNLMLPGDLKKWAKSYAGRKHTTLTRIVVDHLRDLRERERGIDVDQV